MVSNAESGSGGLAGTRSSFVQRVIGAAMLNAATYEEVEADRSAVAQAAAVVLLSSLAAGFGARGFGASRPVDIALYAGISLVAWMMWAVLTYRIGASLLPESQTRADVGELLRTLGFASAPGLLRILGIAPGLTNVVFAVSAVWMLAAMIVAVRQALDYTGTGRAIAVCMLAWVLALIVAVALGIFFGPHVS